MARRSSLLMARDARACISYVLGAVILPQLTHNMSDIGKIQHLDIALETFNELLLDKGF